jgi:hypothetical protein
MQRRRTVWFAATLVLVASLGSRANWLGVSAPPTADEIEYDALARRIVAGSGYSNDRGGPTAFRTPGFPVILATVYWLVGEDPASVRPLLALLTGLGAVLLFVLCLACFGRLDVAAVAGLAWLSLLNGRRLGGALLAEASAADLLLAGLVCLILGDRRWRSVSATLAGIFFGWAILARGYLLFAAVGALVWLWKRGGARRVFICLAASALLPCAWVIRNYTTMGSATLSTQAWSLVWQGNNTWARGSYSPDWDAPTSPQRVYLRSRFPGFDSLGEVDQARGLALATIDAAVDHWPHVLWLLPRKIGLFFSPVSYLGWDWPYLFIIAFVPLGVRRLRSLSAGLESATLLFLPIAGTVVSAMMTIGDPRFRHTVDALLVAIASLGICDFAGELRARASLCHLSILWPRS